MIEGMSTRHAIVPTALGDLTAVVRAGGAGTSVLTGLYFPGHWTLPSGVDFGERDDQDALVGLLAQQLGQYLDGTRTGVDVPLALTGGEHHVRVWQRLRRIPYGATITYGELATELGGAAQAVGRAVGANPISILVPCHRVIGSDGSLTGYAGGLERKRTLLALEEPGPGERDALF